MSLHWTYVKLIIANCREHGKSTRRSETVACRNVYYNKSERFKATTLIVPVCRWLSIWVLFLRWWWEASMAVTLRKRVDKELQSLYREPVSCNCHLSIGVQHIKLELKFQSCFACFERLMLFSFRGIAAMNSTRSARPVKRPAWRLWGWGDGLWYSPRWSSPK